jgi:dihydroorotate dehydrogenase electron transfer subunit
VKVIPSLIEGSQPFGPGLLLHLRWTAPQPACSPGQFFLVRCTPSPDVWDPYLRRALFPAILLPDHLALWLTGANDRGLAWLLAQPAGTPIDVLGPGGHGFDLPPVPGNVLILAQDEGIGPIWPLMAQALGSGSQVVLALGAARGDLAPSPALAPIAAEYRLATADGSAGARGDALDLLAGLDRWPDRIYAALPSAAWPRLRAWIDHWRPILSAGFAQVLAPAQLVCGTGACRACAIASPNGHLTRACVHGPVFDLTGIKRKT